MVLRIVHRGASYYAPENTLEAFKKALELRVDVVELDVHHTKDGELIVMHDDNVSRTTDGVGYIHEFSFKQIRKLHEPNGEPIPTLQEVLDILKNKCICKIDIKDEGTVDKVIKLIKKNNIEYSVIVTCEIPSILKEIKKLPTNIKLEAGGFGRKGIQIKEIIEKAKSVKADIISPHYTITTKKLVDEAHKNGLKVHVWTVDEGNMTEKMKKIGVDGITTNFPDKI